MASDEVEKQHVRGTQGLDLKTAGDAWVKEIANKLACCQLKKQWPQADLLTCYLLPVWTIANDLMVTDGKNPHVPGDHQISGNGQGW